MDQEISVIIPAYGVTGCIAEALDSVLAQTVPVLEILVINDGCPDGENLEKVLAPYIARDQIRYIRQANGGVSAARNTGIRNARAPLTAMLDGDDRMKPHCLEVLLGLLGGNPDTAMAFGTGLFFGGTRLDGQSLMKYFPAPTGNVTYSDLITRRANTTPGVIYNRERLLEIGLYDETLRKAEDFDLALRLARRGTCIRCTETVIFDYRVRPESLSHSGEDIETWRIRALEKQERDSTLSNDDARTVAAELHYQRGALALAQSKRALCEGNYVLARRKLHEAALGLRSRKLNLVGWVLRICPGLLRRITVYREGRT